MTAFAILAMFSSGAVSCGLSSLGLFFCGCLCFVVTCHKYDESPPVVLAIGFSPEILHGLEFQCKSNQENPVQEYFVAKARDSQINFSFL